MQRLDDLNSSLNRTVIGTIREVRQSFDFAVRRLMQVKPAEAVRNLGVANQHSLNALHTVFRHRMSEKRARLDQLQSELKLLSPDQTIARGYSITTDAKTGELIRDHKKLKPGQAINTQVKSGSFTSKVESHGVS